MWQPEMTKLIKAINAAWERLARDFSMSRPCRGLTNCGGMLVQLYCGAWFSVREAADRIALIGVQLDKSYGCESLRDEHFGANTTVSSPPSARSHSLHSCAPAIRGHAR
ncbi:hypothetical protein BN1263170124 [Stenotrophomonas indicatrix]|nr:hypothetical protein BN1263170124 [Stenotrophomonas indicatrix]